MTSPTSGQFAVSLSIASATLRYPWPPAPASALSSRREAGLGVFDDHLTLKFIEGGCDMEK
jgi:hypothetical protein